MMPGERHTPPPIFSGTETIMASLSPVVIALLIVIAVGIAGAIIAYARNASIFSGYAEIAGDARQLQKTLGGELFRDGADLVVAGNFKGLPSVIRFSYSENTPGLNLRMQAPANFSMSIVPKDTLASEGRVVVRTPDEVFDTRFITRSDQPTQAKMFISGRPVVAAMKKLCCSKKTFVSVNTGGMELSELVIPSQPADHVLDHLQAMAVLAQTLQNMPGADKITVTAFRKDRRVIGRAAMVLGIVVAVITVVAATHNAGNHALQVVEGNAVPDGIYPVDAVHISELDKWRPVAIEDFDPSAAAWLRDIGKPVSARIPGDFSGTGHGRDVAYIMVGPNNTKRAVLLAENENRYDTQYPVIAIAARVPKSSVPSIQWASKTIPEPDGDGLLLVRQIDDRKSGLVLFISGRRIVSGVPTDYQSIDLQ